jgi:hypothetical protein
MSITFDELPRALTALLERESFVRVADSAYRSETISVSAADAIVMRIFNGELNCAIEGDRYRVRSIDWYTSCARRASE